MSNNKNLDKLAGEVALEICDPAVVDIVTLKNLATKALGVLQEQGVYAMIVFLLSRSGKEPFEKLKNKDESKAAICCIDKMNDSINRDPMQRLYLNKDGVEKLSDLKLDLNNEMSKKEKQQREKEFQDKLIVRKKSILKLYLDISNSLENLLMVKEFFEQTLIYVRHISEGLKYE